ncbi:MAG: metal-dependent hydrolase [Bacteroidia bacterium]|nr:metal-dependent hydrolase [Bacteroidia bacterium]
MDSITQVVLGAAVGEAVLGKKVGNRAPLWGAVCGTIPDLDVAANFFMDELGALIAHRGITHSIIFSVALAPVMGFLIYRAYKGKWGTQNEWSRLAFWSLITHPILDCFTTWGTQLFYPFSDYRVAFDNIFVADPLYTVPFMIFLIVAMVLRRENRWRGIWNTAGLVISSLYMIVTLVNKLEVNAVFTNALHEQGKSVVRLSTYPTPLNNLLWYCVAEEPSGYDIGYYSLLGDPRSISFIHIPKNHQLIKGQEDNYVIDRLDWVSQGYYSLETRGDTLLWHDLRFGLLNSWDSDSEPQYVFTFEVYTEEGEYTTIHQVNPDLSAFDQKARSEFWKKMWGD